jgi:hypothetical protein
VRDTLFSFRMPLLHSGRVRLLFSSIRPSGVSRATLPLICRCFKLRPSILLRNVFPGRLMLLWHFLPGPFRSPPLRSAGTNRRVGRPTVAVHSCLNRPSRLVRVFKRPRHLTARRRSLDRSSVAPIVSSSVAP